MADSFRLDPRWERQVQAAGAAAMERAAVLMEAGQKRRIPVSVDGSHGREAGYARDRIHIERGVDPIGPWWDIGSDATTPDGTNYPLILELGSPPHEISSHGDYPLRDKHGRVFGKTVQHPGTRPYPWLRASLADIRGQRL